MSVFVPRSIAVALTFAGTVACGDDAFEKSVWDGTFGWAHPITVENAGDAGSVVTRPLGNASDVLAGKSLHDIVIDSNVRVRGDDKPCVACHAWAPNMTRATFCDRVEAFVSMPTATGHGDPASAKPRILKDVLSAWRDRGCPD